MNRYKDYFLKAHSAFSEDSWAEIEDSCSFSHYLDSENKTGWIAVESFKRISVEHIFSFFKIYENLKNSSVNFIFKYKFFLSKEDVKSLFAFCLGENKEFEFSFEPPQILFEAFSVEQLEEIDYLILNLKTLVQFLFSDSITLSVKKSFVSENSVVPEENLNLIQPSHIYSKRNRNSKKGIFTVFCKEERVDQKKNKKFKFGLKNPKTLEFYLFSVKKTVDLKVCESIEENKQYEFEYEITQDSRFSNFIDGFIISVKKLENYDEESILDSSEKQLFPLCVRTKFSAFDGLYYAKDFLYSASERNHKALGIVDFSSVQSFSDLFKVSRELGIKPLYGAEFEIINSDYPIVTGDTNL